MHTLNTMMRECCKAPVTSFTDVIELDSKSVELPQLLRIFEDKCFVASLECVKLTMDLKKVQ